ncbi:ArsR/SmtB family transcription factor [Agromyces bauzanensis]|uniref:HTH-type transcriptional regulator n=1 Tax=Agromyces bauzanensis TaxID=1308924 RepID=A0A917PQB3_9MICO|nr:metalloregulator ArsR/SmtB family transcription factor [Agromyces bauzanensis]GGJ86937.1 putative HTH-type transcriptional regulator [Agromyces bauzanensis]
MESAELPVARLTSELFKAIAHPARVRVIEVLLRGERSVGALAEALGMEISHLSQQLGVLRHANIVDSRRERSSVIYSIRDPRMSQLLAVARQLLTSTLEDSRDLLITIEDLERPTAASRSGAESSR